jgi:hypothetical protein
LYKAIRDDDVHDQLQEDLIEDWWTWNDQQ